VASVDRKPQAALQPRASFFSQDSPARTALLSLLLILAIMAVYFPVHNHPFANIDDPKYVTRNPYIRDGLTPGVAFWALTHGYSSNWHPLTWMSHALDIQLFGLDPAGHHDENVLLHAINAVLLFLVLKRAAGYPLRSFMVAALFALHPLNVESVAWIAERKTLLSTLFCLLALGAYRWYASKPGFVRYLVMTGLFVLGLMSKPQIIMLPLVLLLWDYWPLERVAVRHSPFAIRRNERADTSGETRMANSEKRLSGRRWLALRSSSFALRRNTSDEISGEKRIANGEWRPVGWRWLILEKLPLFFICLVDAVVTIVAQHVGGGPQPYTLWIRIENALVSYVKYIGKAIWPSHLALYYPHPGRAIHAWQVGGAFLILAAITVVAARARRHRYLIVGWLWFLIMLVPMIGIVQADVQGMADRYAYTSFVGLFLMISWGVADWAAEKHLPRLLLPAAGVVALLALSVISYRQVGFWSSDISLWAHSAQVSSGNWKAEYLLGMSLDTDGQHQAAFEHYMRAAAINPRDPFINLSIASYEQQHGNLPLAIEYYKRVLPQLWNSEQRAQTLTNMASAYRDLGDEASANACLAKLTTLRQPAVNWQGNWWKQMLPMIKHYFHGEKGQS